MRGTLLNTATVAVGATVGGLVGQALPTAYQDVALHGLGLVCAGIGISMFLRAKQPLIAAIAVATGGMLGLAIGIHAGIAHFAEWANAHMQSLRGPRFAEGMVTSFVLFCVGPMTLIGCLQDALEGKIELLALKSTMDGIAAIFLAAAMGWGVLVTAGLILVFQGGITLLARPLRFLAKDEEALSELNGAGGAILVGIALGLIGLIDLHTSNYLPAIFIAPAIAVVQGRGRGAGGRGRGAEGRGEGPEDSEGTDGVDGFAPGATGRGRREVF